MRRLGALSHGAASSGLPWPRAATLILAAFVLLIWADPFGLRQRAGTAAKPLLDSNQRFMFPQLVRARKPRP